MTIRSRNFVIASVVAAAVTAGAVFWTLHSIGNDPRYAHVATIEKSATFRNANLLAEAERMPVAQSYLTHHFEYQHNASVCGPTSAADLLRSIGHPESQTDVIAHGAIRTVFGYVIPGLTLDQEASLLRGVTGAPVTLLRDLDLSTFRKYLVDANDPARRFIVNFHRGPMFGRGGGHFSPILAYLPDRDLVLLGDVNQSYGIYLVSSQRLYDAMNTVDSITGKKRGLLMVSLQKAS